MSFLTRDRAGSLADSHELQAKGARIIEWVSRWRNLFFTASGASLAATTTLHFINEQHSGFSTSEHFDSFVEENLQTLILVAAVVIIASVCRFADGRWVDSHGHMRVVRRAREYQNR